MGWSGQAQPNLGLFSTPESRGDPLKKFSAGLIMFSHFRFEGRAWI